MDANRISLRQLHYFITVAEELHFRRAAKRLKISQPPLTQRIKDMERGLGVELFRRLGGRIELTDAGRIVLKSARDVLTQAEGLREVAQRVARGEYGKIRIGLTMTALFFDSIRQAMRSFQQEHPGVALELMLITSGTALAMLRERKLDLCLIRAFPGEVPPDCENIVIARDGLMLVLPAGHKLADRRRVRLSAIVDENYVSLSARRGTAMYHQVTDLWDKSGLKPRITQEADNGPAVLALVAAGFGNAVLPSVLQAIRFDHVLWKKIDTDDRWTNSSMNLVYHGDTLAERAAARLVEYLRQRSGEAPRSV